MKLTKHKTTRINKGERKLFMLLPVVAFTYNKDSFILNIGWFNLLIDIEL